MMRATLIIILALLPLALPAPPEPVRVVLLGEFTPAEQAVALGRVRQAATWWEQRAPAPVYVQAVAEDAPLAAPADLEAWLADLAPHDVYTVYVVRGAALPGGTAGAASHAMRLAILAYDGPFPDAMMAHELGHLLYDLRHTCPLEGSDIMCNHVGAWRLGKLGCGTLAALGAPCQRVGLPLLEGTP